jgi:multicomponent Na+:H+ antiporter subunit E
VQKQDSQKTASRFGYGPFVHALFLCLLLALTWIAFSGHYTPLLLSFGALSVALSVFLSMRMDLIDHEGIPIQLGIGVSVYWLWLAKEVFKANLDVAWRVLQREPDISPMMFEAPVTQKTDLGQVTYANSITLTPGTVSVDLDRGVIHVHALTRAGAEDVLSGEMDRRVTRLEM